MLIGGSMFLLVKTWHTPHISVHDRFCLRQVHLPALQSVLQLQKNDFRRAAGSMVQMARYFPSSLWKPFSSCGSSTPRQVMVSPEEVLFSWPTGFNGSRPAFTRTFFRTFVFNYFDSLIINVIAISYEFRSKISSLKDIFPSEITSVNVSAHSPIIKLFMILTFDMDELSCHIH